MHGRQHQSRGPRQADGALPRKRAPQGGDRRARTVGNHVLLRQHAATRQDAATPALRPTPPEELKLPAPPLPIDDSRGGCDTPGDTEHQAWRCENPGLRIAPEDYISDNGQEIYNLLRSRGIETVFYTGVHANMCILNRTFAIRQMSKWGVRCILLRDLTDAMYNPQDAPRVSHQQGTELVIQYIEKYWSPTALSGDVQEALN